MELHLVEQVVDLPVQQGDLGVNVFGQQHWFLCGRTLLLLSYRLVLPRLESDFGIRGWEEALIIVQSQTFPIGHLRDQSELTVVSLITFSRVLSSTSVNIWSESGSNLAPLQGKVGRKTITLLAHFHVLPLGGSVSSCVNFQDCVSKCSKKKRKKKVSGHIQYFTYN